VAVRPGKCDADDDLLPEDFHVNRAIDAARLQAAGYPFHVSIDTQFTDLDVAAHLNNIAIARFYESARARFNIAAFGRDTFRRDAPFVLVLAETKLRFLAEGSYPDPVQVGCGIQRIGVSSFTVHQGLFQNDACIGVSDCVLVVMAAGRPLAIPTEGRANMQRWLVPGSHAI
jgi:acyl-CoA thioester hydrolase